MGSSYPVFAVAQNSSNNCAVCRAPGQNFQKILDSVSEILWVVGPVSTSPPAGSSNFLLQPLNALSAQAQLTLVSSALLAVYPFKSAADLPSEFIVLAKGKAFIRDWKYVDTLLTRINDVVLQMANSQRIFKEIDPTTLDRINLILRKYDKNSWWYLIAGYQLPLGSTYQNLFAFIQDVLQWAKEFLTFATIDYFTNREELIFVDEYFQTLQDQYSCAQGVSQCSTSFARFKSSVGSSVTKGTTAFKRSIDSITATFRRLKILFNPSTASDQELNSFYQRQNELLRTQYGLRRLNAAGSGFVWWKQMIKNLENLGKQIEQGVLSVPQFFEKDFIVSSKDLVNTLKVQKSPERLNENEWQARSLQLPMASTINDQFTQILGQQAYDIADNALTDSTQITALFPWLSKSVYDGIEAVGWQNDENTIAWNLKKSCDNQCTNVPKVCW